MTDYNRRRFLQTGAIAALAGLMAAPKVNASSTAESIVTGRSFDGTDLSGWDAVLGDGIFSAPGEPPVTDADIATVHQGSYSELQANISKRRIMAHNITVNRMVDATAFSFIHHFGFEFQLPYLPATTNTELNAQTLESGLFIWDGSGTRLDYGLAFQWMLNPWGGGDNFAFGDLRCWTDKEGGQWQKVGELDPVTIWGEGEDDWHEVEMVLDFRRQTTSLKIGGVYYPSQFTAIPKPEDWGTETAPGIQVEIISLWPGDGEGALHKARFKDWYWIWEPYIPYATYLPAVFK